MMSLMKMIKWMSETRIHLQFFTNMSIPRIWGRKIKLTREQVMDLMELKLLHKLMSIVILVKWQEVTLFTTQNTL